MNRNQEEDSRLCYMHTAGAYVYRGIKRKKQLHTVVLMFRNAYVYFDVLFAKGVNLFLGFIENGIFLVIFVMFLKVLIGSLRG